MKLFFALLMLLMAITSFAQTQQKKKNKKCQHAGEGKLHRRSPRKMIKIPNLHQSHPYTNPLQKIAPLPNYKVDFKILILSATDNPVNEPTYLESQKALQSLGMPFDVMVLTKNGIRQNTGALNLINADGSGKYYGIVTTTGELAFQSSPDVWDSALTNTQWEELKNYEAQYSVRRVSLYTFPSDLIGASLIAGKENGNPNYLIFTSAVAPFASGIPTAAKPPLKETWLLPAKIINATLTKSFMLFKDSTVAATTSKFTDGREQLHFFFDQSIYIAGSSIIAPVWIKWLTRNSFVGKRRIYLGVEIDDMYLETDIWDPATQTTPEDGSKIYRVNANDIAAAVDFQNNYLRPTTANPNYRFEIAYNGGGVIDAGGYANDALFKKTKTVATSFNWLSHTWDHEDLTNLNYQQTTNELTQNYVPPKNLLVWGTNYFSMNSMVTPGISGLFNPNALKAIFDQNIVTVTGDNSRPELVNEANPYIGLYTTIADNGFAGVFILPRHATEVYYNTTTKAEMTSLYNFLYRDYFGFDSTFAQIMVREEELALTHLLRFEPAPFMFHQANLKRFLVNGTYESLLSTWMRQILNGIRKYSSLPVLNYKLNDLRQIYNTRQSFEKCGFKGQLEVANFQITKLNANSSSACQVAVTGISGTGTGISQETYGPDSTLLISMDGVNGKSITITNPIPVN